MQNTLGQSGYAGDVARLLPPQAWSTGGAPKPRWRTGSQTDGRQLINAFGPSGGVANGDAAATLLRCRCEQPISTLARWIVERRIVSFVWRDEILVPLFQFDLERACLRPGVGDVIAELSAVFDDWELATWFASPNSWLFNAVPADALPRDFDAVLAVARADRFVAKG
jgi:hypothetical protein